MTMKKICVVGHLGNMGKRYCTILDYLGIPYQGIDFQNRFEEVENDVGGIMIVTPTDLHYSTIVKYSKYNLPILCEKPISKDLNQLSFLLSHCSELSMINQYRYFYTQSKGLTVVENYNTGNDGLLWDCINLIGMANGDIELTKNSPVWNIELNGKRINRGHIDSAYVNNIRDWISGNLVESVRYIRNTHKKVKDYEEKLIGCDWYSGKEVFISSTGKIDKKAF